MTASIIRGYDSLGRLTSYTDADGQVSTTTYDFMSRPVTTDDGKGTQTRYYDEGSERRGLLTRLVDSHAGTWTATYDVAGTPTVDWPNGLRQTTTVSETGEPIKITYVKTGCTGDDCIWLSNEVRDSAHGQVNLADGLSEQAFGYDKAGRLVTAFDQQSPVCLTRSYTYDVDSNRTAEAAYGPAADGACQTTSVASSETHNYDQADRITDAGYAYDALGRTVVVPDGDTLDLGGASGAATVSYHVNDLVRSIAQGAGATTTYNLDVDGQRIRSKVTGATTVLNHYDGDGDNPSWWTSASSSWTRAVGGPAGGLVATYDGASGTTSLQLANLHGDIVATASSSPSATALTATFESTEFGIPRSTVAAAPRYSWLGKAERASDNPAGLTLMGVRLYNPASGRFLQTDPIVGGNANAYDYCTGDPLNCFDLDGRWGFKKWINRQAKRAWSATGTASTWLTDSKWGKRIHGLCGYAYGAIGNACSAIYVVAYGRQERWSEARGELAGALLGSGVTKAVKRGYGRIHLDHLSSRERRWHERVFHHSAEWHGVVAQQSYSRYRD